MKIKFLSSICFSLFALLVVSTTSCGGNASNNGGVVADSAASTKNLKIAYVLIDTLTSQYELYKEASENFQNKRNNAEATITKKGQNFAMQLEQFQNKLRANQLTQMQAEKEQARLAKLQQDLQDLEVSLSASLQEEYQKELQALTDTIQTFMSVYAKGKGYDFVLCKSSGIDNVLYANEEYDVTAEVVAALNEKYFTQKAAEAKNNAGEKK
jgi:outer membrane protein